MSAIHEMTFTDWASLLHHEALRTSLLAKQSLASCLMRLLCVITFALHVSSALASDYWTTSRIQGTPEPAKPFVAEQVFAGVALNSALDMGPVPELNQWLFVENGGKLWCVPNDITATKAEVALDLKALHPNCDHVYGVTFHPKFGSHKQIFITYTNGDKLDDGSRLSRFKVAQEVPLVIDPASEQILMTWPSGGHNGAAVCFGNDGLLYLSTGDAEVPAPPDPRVTGQDISDLLSSVLRIDVDHADPGKPYAVPQDNPFLTMPKARPEIYAFGLRNPWKMSFDRVTGNLWCGDVGWEQWEQIFLIKRGANYGWSAMEGNNPILPERKSTVPITPPIVTHDHTEAASITGGFVYRGKRLPELVGAYVYGDYETGKIWALWHDGQQVTRHEEIADTSIKIVSFGQGEDGDVYFLHWGNPSTVHRLVRNPKAGKPSSFPRKLSETGLLTDIANHALAPGVKPYAILAPMWADGAEGVRMAAFTQGKIEAKVWTNKKTGKTESKVTWPAGTVLAKTLAMQLDQAKPDSSIKVETQVLHYDGEAWNAYSYRWNEAQTDAEIVGPHGDERKLDLVGDQYPGGKHRYNYRFHSRAECLRCHNAWSGFALSFQPQQLMDEAGWLASGVVDENFFKCSEARLVNPYAEQEPLEARARSWLHTNCAHCHRQNGGGSVPLMVNAEMALMEMRAVEEKPTRGDFGVQRASVIAPRVPYESVLLHRLATSGAGHMPVIGAHEVDSEGLVMLAEWIDHIERVTEPQGMVFAPPASSVRDAWNDRWIQTKDDWLAYKKKVEVSRLPYLINNTETALFCALRMKSGFFPDEDQAEVLKLASQSSNAHIRALFERFLPDSQRVETLGASASVEKILAHKGDSKRGAELFSSTGKAAACLACHFVNGSGRDFGPDLSKVGVRLNQAQLIESLLAPSKLIVPGYQPVVLTMKGGGAQSGFIVKREGDDVLLKIATGQSVPLKKAEVQSEQTLPVSLMPEGLLQSFTAHEAADLIEYLGSLK